MLQFIDLGEGVSEGLVQEHDSATEDNQDNGDLQVEDELEDQPVEELETQGTVLTPITNVVTVGSVNHQHA